MTLLPMCVQKTEATNPSENIVFYPRSLKMSNAYVGWPPGGSVGANTGVKVSCHRFLSPLQEEICKHGHANVKMTLIPLRVKDHSHSPHSLTLLKDVQFPFSVIIVRR